MPDFLFLCARLLDKSAKIAQNIIRYLPRGVGANGLLVGLRVVGRLAGGRRLIYRVKRNEMTAKSVDDGGKRGADGDDGGRHGKNF